ncbi:MAG: 50S ribosomal protein L21 [Deltaproteobacteria bacterium]|nr:50S ribosomal protein L21 [Deltaproteobacteria bacterium]
MFAVIHTGGKQYKVAPGDHLRIEKIEGDKGAKVSFDKILLVGENDAIKVGTPFLAGAKVAAEIVVQDKAKKIIVFKLKRRKNYRRKYGHRQPFTEIKITGIEA